MRRSVIIILCSALSLILAGCGTLRTTVVERTTHDTLYLNKIQYDSIYIDNYQTTDRINDTVYLDKTRIEFRYKLLRDTVKSVHIDSIPVIHEVQVTKTERYIPSIYKWSLAICIILLILVMLYVIWKIFIYRRTLL